MLKLKYLGDYDSISGVVELEEYLIEVDGKFIGNITYNKSEESIFGIRIHESCRRNGYMKQSYALIENIYNIKLKPSSLILSSIVVGYWNNRGHSISEGELLENLAGIATTLGIDKYVWCE